MCQEAREMLLPTPNTKILTRFPAARAIKKIWNLHYLVRQASGYVTAGVHVSRVQSANRAQSPLVCPHLLPDDPANCLF